MLLLLERVKNWTDDDDIQRAGERSRLKKGENGEGYSIKKTKKVGFSMHTMVLITCSSQRGGTRPLDRRSSPAKLNAQSIATELSWDPDMRPDVPTVPLLAPQPEVREKKLGRLKTAMPLQKSAYFTWTCVLHIYSYSRWN